jgi:hypothetical protein
MKLLRFVVLALALSSVSAWAQTQNTPIAYDSGPVAQSSGGAVSSSSHAAGTSLGGLLTIPLARLIGGSGSGIITNLLYLSPNGSTGSVVVRIWEKSPSSTCTDNTAYSNNAADDAYLITAPINVAPTAPAATTGDARTYGALGNLSLDYKNADTPGTKNLYACVVTVATDTADESSTVKLMLSGPQN